MIPLFENAGLIGLGLIGGSLARAIKLHHLAGKVTGHTQSPASTRKALELGLIDNIANSPAEMAAICDIIIICTPLGAYEQIFQEIAPVLQGKNCIISDVGSLKLPVISLAETYLLPENLTRLVPAHPIAGTEKTGLESGFAQLFEHKQVILTPHNNTSPQAIELVSRLWHGCGSATQIMPPGVHDKIYAEVSHLPQFLAYCYAHFLLDNRAFLDDITALKNNAAFLKFSRICASDPTIWLDIFTMNLQNLLLALEKFTTAFQHISKMDIPTAAVQQDNAAILTRIIPAMLSGALLECSTNAQYAGSGFADFTSYNGINLSSAGACADTKIATFLLKIKEFSRPLQNSDYQAASLFMHQAVDFYRALESGTLRA